MKLNGGLCTGASLNGFNGDWKMMLKSLMRKLKIRVCMKN